MNNYRVIEKLKGKRLSILGDSISTFDGYSNNSTYNRTLVSNATYYRQPFNVDDTYWMMLIKNFGLELCVNNSWSGAYLTKHFPNVGGDYDACLSPGVERVKYLANNSGVFPDIVIVFMGANDVGVDITVNQFEQAYTNVLDKIKKTYGDIIIICIGLPNILNERMEKTKNYNKEIIDLIKNFNHTIFVDLYTESEDDYRLKTLDGVHPDKEGMLSIYNSIVRSLQTYYN